jgi:hypothetical protein
MEKQTGLLHSSNSLSGKLNALVTKVTEINGDQELIMRGFHLFSYLLRNCLRGKR